MARDHLTDADARARLAAQWPIEEKVKRAHHVIWTDRGFAETDGQIKTLHARLRAVRRAEGRPRQQAPNSATRQLTSSSYQEAAASARSFTSATSVISATGVVERRLGAGRLSLHAVDRRPRRQGQDRALVSTTTCKTSISCTRARCCRRRSTLSYLRGFDDRATSAPTSTASSPLKRAGELVYTAFAREASSRILRGRATPYGSSASFSTTTRRTPAISRARDLR